jgi:hypothetical protein
VAPSPRFSGRSARPVGGTPFAGLRSTATSTSSVSILFHAALALSLPLAACGGGRPTADAGVNGDAPASDAPASDAPSRDSGVGFDAGPDASLADGGGGGLLDCPGEDLGTAVGEGLRTGPTTDGVWISS